MNPFKEYYTLEGFGNNAFNSQYGNEAIISDGQSATTASAYQTTLLAPGVSFDSYKRPTAIQTPRGEYNALAPTTMTASDYLRKRYGDFSGATEVGSPPAVPAVSAVSAAQTQIMGTTALTVGDLKLLQNVINIELLRLQNIRTVDTVITVRKAQLEELANNVADVLGLVERGEIKVEDVAIFPATARQFLKTFQTAETLPELFDPNGNSPASSVVSSAGPSVANSPSSDKPDFLQWLYTNIQRLKWSIDLNYNVELAKQREMQGRLQDMETRIIGHSYTDAPMPEGYQHMFLERIRGIQKELNESPE